MSPDEIIAECRDRRQRMLVAREAFAALTAEQRQDLIVDLLSKTDHDKIETSKVERQRRGSIPIVVERILYDGRPRSATDIYHEASSNLPGLSKASVIGAVIRLQKKNILRIVASNGRAALFAVRRNRSKRPIALDQLDKKSFPNKSSAPQATTCGADCGNTIDSN